MSFYKFPHTPKNIILLLPRMIGIAGILLVMFGYMCKHMYHNKCNKGVYWYDID